MRSSHLSHLLTLLGALLLAAACQDAAPIHTTVPVTTGPAPDIVGPDADAGDDLGDTGGDDADGDAGDDAAPDPAARPTAWMVHVSPDAPEAIQWTAQDLHAYLGRMGQQAALVQSTQAPDCEPGVGHVVLTGDGILEPALGADATPQTFYIHERHCEGTGALITLGGGGLLGRQYAAYDLLHQLGVRFFHPEQEFVPTAPRWPAARLDRRWTPAFRFRSVSLHLTHPLEMGDPFRLQDPTYFPEVKRFIDWEIKNLASSGKAGAASGEYTDYGARRGFPREAGFALNNQQQGVESIIDPDDPRPWQEQVAEAIEERMGDDPDRYPGVFGFTFNPSEFTEIEDTLAVEELTFIADYFAEHYPDTRLTTINHGTAGAPTANYGVRFYDLSKFAPPNLGVRVHTLMFYDLFRPAPVYGNTSFRFQYDFMVDQHLTRPLWHYPESAWWLTFDIAVPLYLPITIEARHRDIQGIKWMLAGKLEGHHVFGTGHEWGYWQNEYCSFRMAVDTDYSYRDCLSDIAAPFGQPTGQEVVAALEQVIDYQERDIIYGELLRWLVGTDPETEIAYGAGIVFHPLPPAISEIVTAWTEEEARAWLDRTAAQLQTMEEDYAALVDRLRALRPTVEPGALPFFDEILDGVEVTGLRARHARHVYGAAITFRLGQLTADAALLDAAQSLLDEARRDTEAAREVVERREQGYRYQPLARSIAGGPNGEEDENWTVYRYRYLNRTHHVYYYTRIDDLVEAALRGASRPVEVEDALLAPSEPLRVRVLDLNLTEPMTDPGDGSDPIPGREIEHTYAAPGVYTLTTTGQRMGQPFTFSGDVARLSVEYRATSGARVVDPAGAALIAGLIPKLVCGRADADTVVMGFDTRGDGTVSIEAWRALTSSDEGPLTSAPTLLHVPITSGGEIVAQVSVQDAQLSLDPETLNVDVTGNLQTQDIITAIVEIGGFEPDGARAAVASTLGYTPDTLPEAVFFHIQYTVEEHP